MHHAGPAGGLRSVQLHPPVRLDGSAILALLSSLVSQHILLFFNTDRFFFLTSRDSSLHRPNSSLTTSVRLPRVLRASPGSPPRLGRHESVCLHTGWLLTTQTARTRAGAVHSEDQVSFPGQTPSDSTDPCPPCTSQLSHSVTEQASQLFRRRRFTIVMSWVIDFFKL